MSYGFTSSGLVAPRTADFLTLFEEAYEAETGLSHDWTPDTALGALRAVTATLANEVGELLQSVHDAFDRNNSQGAQTDALGLLVGVPRKAATFSQATVTVDGTTGTVIPQGSRVQGGGDDDEALWRTTADVTLTAGTDTVVVQCTVTGAVEAAIGEIDKIVTPVDGWDSVTNAAAASPGIDLESEADYKARQEQAVQTDGTPGARLRTELLAIDAITGAVVVDNDTNAATITSGVSLDAHSVAVIVYPSSLTDAQKESVARLIYEYAGSSKTMGTDETATITNPGGSSKTIRWDYATDVSVDVVATITLKTGFALSDVESTAEEAIADYFSSLTVGDPVRILQIMGLLADIDGIATASVTLDAGSSDITPNLNEIAVIGTNSVTT